MAEKNKNLKLKILSANVGNVWIGAKKFTYSLENPIIIKGLSEYIKETKPDIILFQEVWTHTKKILGEDYDSIGLNDSIAIKKNIGYIDKSTFKSHCKKFILNNKLKGLKDIQYNGEFNPNLGIPACFDISSVEIIIKNNHQKVNNPNDNDNKETEKSQSNNYNKEHNKFLDDRILIINVHIESGPWNDKIRAKQLKRWLLDPLKNTKWRKFLERKRIIIAGDFNFDEQRQLNDAAIPTINEILSMNNINDASELEFNNVISKTKLKKVTTSYPFKKMNFRFDHLFGTGNFDYYNIIVPLDSEYFNKLKNKWKFLWWLHLDHLAIQAIINFE